MKARQLPSGSWNVRIMCNGKSYSFTDPDKRRVMRRAAEFAEQCREDIDNPRLADALEKYVEERAESLSPATIRGYNSIVRAIRTQSPIANKRIMSLTDRDIQTIIRNIDSPKTQRNYVNLISSATGRKFSVHYRNKRPKEIQVPTALEVLGLVQIFRKTELEVPVLLGAYAGLRRGEICALTIQDLDGDYLHISKDMVLVYLKRFLNGDEQDHGFHAVLVDGLVSEVRVGRETTEIDFAVAGKDVRILNGMGRHTTVIRTPRR